MSSKYKTIIETPIVGLTCRREVDQANESRGKDDHSEKRSIASGFSTMDFIRDFSRFKDNPSQPVAKPLR